MKPEIRDRWVEALESGDYPQTASFLCNEDGYCCLGVLSELAAEDGVIEKLPDFGEGCSYGHVRDGEDRAFSATSLVSETVKWAGLKDHDPKFMIPADHPVLFNKNMGNRILIYPDKYSLSAVELNDELLFTFKEIAALIREGYMVS